MARTFFETVCNWFLHWGGDSAERERVEYSIDKYRKTYELLEKYDKKTTKNPADLVKPVHLRKDIRNLSKKMGV